MLDELVSYIDAEGGVAYSSQLKGAGFSAGLIWLFAFEGVGVVGGVGRVVAG